MTQFRDITLTVTPGAWGYFSARKQDPAFQYFYQQTIQRDNYTCQFCGFQAKDFLDVVNLDHNYQNNQEDNLVTACPFCSQCFFLEAAGVGDDAGGGTILYLPEIRQTDINSFCHVLFCAIANGTNYKDGAQSAYRNLKLRSQIIEEKFGPGTSNPAIFGQLMIDYVLSNGKPATDIMKDLRLLPSATKFRKHIEQWAKTAFMELQARTQ